MLATKKVKVQMIQKTFLFGKNGLKSSHYEENF
jgi:hypothetical protein